MTTLTKERKLISSGSQYEAAYGYSRAVVDGPWVFVSGTTGFDYKTHSISDDPLTQTKKCFENIEKALQEAGANLKDLVRVTYYMTDRKDYEIILQTAGSILKDVRPAATGLICGLIDPRMKIEIEATAYKKDL